MSSSAESSGGKLRDLIRRTSSKKLRRSTSSSKSSLPPSSSFNSGSTAAAHSSSFVPASITDQDTSGGKDPGLVNHAISSAFSPKARRRQRREKSKSCSVQPQVLSRSEDGLSHASSSAASNDLPSPSSSSSSIASTLSASTTTSSSSASASASTSSSSADSLGRLSTSSVHDVVPAFCRKSQDLPLNPAVPVEPFDCTELANSALLLYSEQSRNPERSLPPPLLRSFASALCECFRRLCTRPQMFHEVFTLVLNHAEDKRPVSNMIIELLQKCDCLHSVLYHLIEKEFRESASDPTSIMREDSLVSSLMVAYARQVGGHYLKRVIGPLVLDVIRDKSLNFDIREEVCNTTDEHVERLDGLADKVELVFRRITSVRAIAFFPRPLRVLVYYIGELAKKYAPQYLTHFVGGFVILRYLNPAITVPKLIPGLLDNPDDLALLTSPNLRNLLNISKVLQAICNQTAFSVGVFRIFNPIIAENAPQMKWYAQELCKDPSEERWSDFPYKVRHLDHIVPETIAYNCYAVFHAAFRRACPALLTVLSRQGSRLASGSLILGASAPVTLTRGGRSESSPVAVTRQRKHRKGGGSQRHKGASSESTPTYTSSILPSSASSSASESASASSPSSLRNSRRSRTATSLHVLLSVLPNRLSGDAMVLYTNGQNAECCLVRAICKELRVPLTLEFVTLERNPETKTFSLPRVTPELIDGKQHFVTTKKIVKHILNKYILPDQWSILAGQGEDKRNAELVQFLGQCLHVLGEMTQELSDLPCVNESVNSKDRQGRLSQILDQLIRIEGQLLDSPELSAACTGRETTTLLGLVLATCVLCLRAFPIPDADELLPNFVRFAGELRDACSHWDDASCEFAGFVEFVRSRCGIRSSRGETWSVERNGFFEDNVESIFAKVMFASLGTAPGNPQAQSVLNVGQFFSVGDVQYRSLFVVPGLIMAFQRSLPNSKSVQWSTESYEFFDVEGEHTRVRCVIRNNPSPGVANRVVATWKNLGGIEVSALNLQVHFFCSPADQVYALYMDAVAFRKRSKSEAEIDPHAGGKFTYFDGSVSGEFLRLRKNRHISMTWVEKDWPRNFFSQVIINIEPNIHTHNGCLMTFSQQWIPTTHLRAVYFAHKSALWVPCGGVVGQCPLMQPQSSSILRARLEQELEKVEDLPETDPSDHLRLQARDWKLLLCTAGLTTYSVGDQILQQSRPNDCLYKIISGSVRVESVFKREGLSRMLPLATLNAPSVFGELSLLDFEGVTTARVMADTQTTIAKIPIPSLTKIFDADHDLMLRFFKHLAHHLATQLNSVHKRSLTTDQLATSSDLNLIQAHPTEQLTANQVSLLNMLEGMSFVEEEDDQAVESVFFAPRRRLEHAQSSPELDGQRVIAQYMACVTRRMIRSHGTLFVCEKMVVFSCRVFNLRTRDHISYDSLKEVTQKKDVLVLRTSKTCLKLRLPEVAHVTELIQQLWHGSEERKTVQRTNSDAAMSAVLKSEASTSSKSPEVVSKTFFSNPIAAIALSRSDWEEVLGSAKSVTFAKDEIVVKENSLTTALYQISCGKCMVWKSVNGEDTRIGSMSVGELFGDVSLVLGTTATATVRAAVDNTECYVIEKEFVTLLTQVSPLLAARFYHFICTTLCKRFKLQESRFKQRLADTQQNPKWHTDPPQRRAARGPKLGL